MDVVLGLSMTQSAVRWVLADGASADGGPIGRGTFPVDAAGLDADRLVSGLLAQPALDGARIEAVGVASTRATVGAADAVMNALEAHGVEAVVPVSEAAAVDALAGGIADVAELDDIVVVCVLDTREALVAVVDPGGVRVERVDVRADAPVFADTVLAVWAADVRQPEAIFVLGCGDLDAIVTALGAAAGVPAMSAADADLALARGAALASTALDGSFDEPAAWERTRRSPKVLALTSVLSAAVVTLVVSSAVALGMASSSDIGPREAVDTADQAAGAPSPAKAAPIPPPAPTAPVVPSPAAEPIALTPPSPEVLPEPPIEAPEPAPYVAPEPEYMPPAAPPVAAPEYVPPPAAPPYVPPQSNPYVPPIGTVQQPALPPGVAPPAVPPPPVEQPRLRDRIIDKIPLLNRIGD